MSLKDTGDSRTSTVVCNLCMKEVSLYVWSSSVKWYYRSKSDKEVDLCPQCTHANDKCTKDIFNSFD